MKVDQTNLVSLAVAPSRQQLRNPLEITAGDSKKKVVSEPRRDPEPSQVEGRSKPIVLNRAQVRLRFEQDKDTGIQIIQIVDAESGKLVRQIPPEELLNITKALRDIKGLIVSKES